LRSSVGRGGESFRKDPNVLRAFFAALAAAFALAACAGSSTSATNGALPRSERFHPASGSSVIQHVVVVIQENRSFDDLFATFPGAAGTTYGCMKSPSASAFPIAPRARHASASGSCPTGDQQVALQEVNLAEKCDFGHSYNIVAVDYDDRKMDGFGEEGGGPKCHGKAGTKVYQYANTTQIAPYWDIAKEYVLGDEMFQTQGSGSFTAHQDLIAGATIVNGASVSSSDIDSVVDFPTSEPWGCDNKNKATKTSLLVWDGSTLNYKHGGGPFPCFTYQTLRDLLDAKGVSWKYYSPPSPNGTGKLWNGFDAIKAVRDGPEWKTNVAQPTQFFTDVSNGALPAVSWVVPDEVNSDHPGNGSDTGPSWVASIVNAIGGSSYWDSTAIVVVWDDWGGFYDNTPPPFFDHLGGLGFRVPMLLVSAYARETSSSQPGYISNTQYEFGSILKFIEDVWDLGSLGTTDVRANSISDCFDFTQSARSFVAIPSTYSRSYFMHQKPSNLPVDTE
jgi:phospholipase C